MDNRKFERDCFYFFKSWFDAIENEDAEIQLAILKDIINYALFGIEPDCEKGVQKMFWIMAKPTLDKGIKQYLNGKNGGAPKGNINAQKQPKNNPKTTQNNPKTTDNIIDIDKDKDIDNKKENLIKESEDDERGIFESLGVEEKKPFFSLLDCWRLFEDWRDVNEIDARQLAWHNTDAKVQTICRNIASAPEGERADMIRQLSWDSAHMARLAVNRETWRGMWQVCKLITKHKFSHLQREKIVTTFDELNKLELPDFYTRFVKQVEYMTGQERINDVEKCLKFEFRNELEQCQ